MDFTKIAICDNNLSVCDYIAALIQNHENDIQIFKFTSIEELLRYNGDFSIIFLDIKGVNGLEAARIIRRRQETNNNFKSIIIFITGYSEYMQNAFDVQAFHYLIKPIDEIKFSQVLKCALKEIKLIKTQSERYILIKINDIRKKILLTDIIFVESFNKKVVFHTQDKIYETYGKMNDLEIALGSSFYRCHRCYIVNLEKISAYNQNTIYLTSGKQIMIAQKKYSDFLRVYLKYAREGGFVNV